MTHTVLIKRISLHFLQVYKEMLSCTEIVLIYLSEFRDAFNLFDLDHDGRITAIELRTVMTKLRQPVSSAEVDDMIQRADKDGYQFTITIIVEGFINMITNLFGKKEQDLQCRKSFEFHSYELNKIFYDMITF